MFKQGPQRHVPDAVDALMPQVWCAISMVTAIRRRTVVIRLIHLAGGRTCACLCHWAHCQPSEGVAGARARSFLSEDMDVKGATSGAGTVQSCRAKAVAFNSILMERARLGPKVEDIAFCRGLQNLA